MYVHTYINVFTFVLQSKGATISYCKSGDDPASSNGDTSDSDVVSLRVYIITYVHTWIHTSICAYYVFACINAFIHAYVHKYMPTNIIY